MPPLPLLLQPLLWPCTPPPPPRWRRRCLSVVACAPARHRPAGTIPKSWNNAGTFPRASLFTLHFNNLTGDLPEPVLWPELQVGAAALAVRGRRVCVCGRPRSAPGSPGRPRYRAAPTRAPRLGAAPPVAPQVLRLQNNNFTGTLPASWPQALPKLKIMSLHENAISGPLPLAWAASTGFQELEEAYLQDNRVRACWVPGWRRVLPGGCCTAGAGERRSGCVRPALPAPPLPAPPLTVSAPFLPRSARAQLTGTLPANKAFVLTLPRLRILDMSCECLPTACVPPLRARTALRMCCPCGGGWGARAWRCGLQPTPGPARLPAPAPPAVNPFQGVVPPGWGTPAALDKLELL